MSGLWAERARNRKEEESGALSGHSSPQTHSQKANTVNKEHFYGINK